MFEDAKDRPKRIEINNGRFDRFHKCEERPVTNFISMYNFKLINT